MAVLDKLFVGLEIIYKYEPNCDFAAEHDEVFCGSNITKNNATFEEKERLEQAGWSWDESLSCYKRFV